MKILVLVIFSFITCIYSTGQTPIFFPGSVWQYTSGGPLPATWTGPGYDDLWWLTDTAELGYGDGDEHTLVMPGSITANYPTYYFRKNIFIADTSLYPAGYIVGFKRDDAILLYINGVEVYRDNISYVNPSYYNLAAGPCLDDGNSWINLYIPAQYFHNGNNLLAAEVHQYEALGGDLSFDCTLNGLANVAPICTRGPYIQKLTENQVTIKWRTQIPSSSQVKFGTIFNNYTDSVLDAAISFDHEVILTGLNPATKYYYTIGSSNYTTLQDSAQYFFTNGIMGSPYEIDIWITGDCGTGYLEQKWTADAFINHVNNKYMDAWLLLGDNAYMNGFDVEYQTNFFNVYKNYRFLSQTCIWPAPGNHDYYTNNDLDSPNRPYNKIFTVPTAGEAGGVASGTESYYSYNIGNVHFISLDSYGTVDDKKMYDTTSQQAQWLKQDLENNNLPWTIVYWHHPPYTMGSHNSDVENDLVDIRSKLLVILEQYQVDLVLCGHSHQYERSKLMKGHYGLESTFDSLVHHTSSSSAKYDGSDNSCPYFKETSDSVNKGIVYVVAGSAGKHTTVNASWPHNAMFYSNTANSGSMYLKVNNNRLDAEFISHTGVVQDRFTIMKDVNQSIEVLTPPSTPIQLTASWIGNYYWENTGDTLQSITQSFTQDTLLIVHDPLNCVADTFHIQVGYIGTENIELPSLKVFPNPAQQNFSISLPYANEWIQLEILSANGTMIYQKNWLAEEPIGIIEPGFLNPGLYMIRLSFKDRVFYSKLIWQ